MKKYLGILAAVFWLSGCDNPSIIGEWIQPVPGIENQVQGIRINEGGEAKSINMQTLQYHSWRHNGDHLILSGESIGNAQTIEFTEVYEVKRLTRRKLILQNEDGKIEFRRKDS